MITYQLIPYANNYCHIGRPHMQSTSVKIHRYPVGCILLYRMKNKKYLEMNNYVQ